MSCFADTVYPFTGLVGQDKMKLALILVAINPRIGGVLIRGEKGTAKSTAVRALANLLPEIEVVEDCPFGCSPGDVHLMCESCRQNKDLLVIKRKMKVVNLPVSATEDRVVGTLDIEKAIKKGEKHFEPGVLASANRGILYIDEVNLLDDHLVDVLLDSAAMGVNIVEREGVSFSHPAHFMLVGTMNPEEGELRPQIVDRFGLCVDIEGVKETALRVEIIKRRARYEQDPHSFYHEWKAEEKRLSETIVKAKELLKRVAIADELLNLIAQIAVDMGVDGHRADIVMMKTAETLTAYHSRTQVTEDDVKEAAELVLPHRMRRKPFQEQKMDTEKLQETMNKHKQQQQQTEQQQQQEQEKKDQSPSDEQTERQSSDASTETHFEVGEPYNVQRIILPQDRNVRSSSGRRSTTCTDSKSGRYVRSTLPDGKCTDLAFDATLRAASPYQAHRDKNGVALNIRQEDIRQKVRKKKIGNTILFVVDASGSMGANQRMVETKGAILSLLIDAYQKRDKVGLVAFKGNQAELLLPPTSSVEMAKDKLKELPTGGKTPLPQGLLRGYEVLMQEKKRDTNCYPLLVVLTDGRANAGTDKTKSPIEEAKDIALRIKEAGIRSLVINTEKGFLSLSKALEIAEAMGAKYLELEDLNREQIVAGIKGVL
ncbi:putative cobaltochelatase [bacterium]|nr:putative cobaltochelatase [bacterium]MBU2599639.1 putative cobaltochelatase [bacterium]